VSSLAWWWLWYTDTNGVCSNFHQEGFSSGGHPQKVVHIPHVLEKPKQSLSSRLFYFPPAAYQADNQYIVLMRLLRDTMRVQEIQKKQGIPGKRKLHLTALIFVGFKGSKITTFFFSLAMFLHYYFI